MRPEITFLLFHAGRLLFREKQIPGNYCGTVFRINNAGSICEWRLALFPRLTETRGLLWSIFCSFSGPRKVAMGRKIQFPPSMDQLDRKGKSMAAVMLINLRWTPDEQKIPFSVQGMFCILRGSYGLSAFTRNDRGGFLIKRFRHFHYWIAVCNIFGFLPRVLMERLFLFPPVVTEIWQCEVRKPISNQSSSGSPPPMQSSAIYEESNKMPQRTGASTLETHQYGKLTKLGFCRSCWLLHFEIIQDCKRRRQFPCNFIQNSEIIKMRSSSLALKKSAFVWTHSVQQQA